MLGHLIMKTRILFLSLWLAALACAGPVTLQWSLSPDAAVTGYYLYAGTNSLLASTNAPLVKLFTGTNRTATVECTNATRWYFAATACDSNRVESDFSNEVTVQFVRPPASLYTLAVEHALDLSNSNGWAEVGFFRLKINAP